MRFRHKLERLLRGPEGSRETVYRIRYWWPARRGQKRTSKVDPKTFRRKALAQAHAYRVLDQLEEHAAGRGPDPFAERQDNLVELLELFLEDLAAGALSNKRRKGKPAQSRVDTQRRRLTLLFDRFKLTDVGDLRELGADINRGLDSLQQDLIAVAEAAGRRRGWGDKTRDEHGHAMVQFGQWLVSRKVLHENPFDEFRRVETDASRTFFRRELNVDELQKLMGAAEADGDPLRATLYAFVAVTGTREAQCASLTWADVRGLGSDEIDIRVDAGRTKAKRAEWMPLPGWLGARLATFRRVPLTIPVFPGFDWPNICRQLRRDAAAAGLGSLEKIRKKNSQGVWSHWERWVDPRGPKWTLDFHAFRNTCANLLDREDVGDRDWADLVRHGDSKMTRRYRNVNARRQRAIIEAIPELVCTPCARGTHSAGTVENDGDSPARIESPQTVRGPDAGAG